MQVQVHLIRSVNTLIFATSRRLDIKNPRKPKAAGIFYDQENPLNPGSTP
jgi:hypothetical protein